MVRPGVFTYDSTDPAEAMDVGYYDTAALEEGSSWIVKIGEKTLVVSPRSPIVPKEKEV